MEAVSDLDRLIERRASSDPDPDEREESYMQSVRRYNARRRDERLWEKLQYHEAMIEAHARDLPAAPRRTRGRPGTMRGDVRTKPEQKGNNVMQQSSYQLPASAGAIVDLGGRLFKKKILPYRTISYRGGKLSIDRQTAEKIVQSFKRGALQFVPFVLGGHSDDPTKTGGRVESLSAEEDGLYARIETNPAGEEAIRRNFNALPVSVRYISDYHRESDGVRFGPTLAHIASTFSPRMTAMGGWQTVEASGTPGAFVDLSEGSWNPGSMTPEQAIAACQSEHGLSFREAAERYPAYYPETAESVEEVPDDYGDRMARRIQEYADKHDVPFAQAARHVV